MNIHELDSYNLGDAVKFNDKLNPRIWGADEKMRPEVREQLLKIADDFREFLGIDVEVKDITVSGSNAAYTYTPHSDIDLHLVVDLPEADRNEVYRELFDAKKYAYNEQHDIQIGGSDVELYVQDANKKHVSQGIYSLINNDWVSVPKRRRPDVDDISVKSKFEDLGHRIEAAIDSGDYEKISNLAQKIKDYRQAGLDEHGEFGAENLAFKILRTQGLIKKLYDARAAAKDELLSLDERKKKKKKTRYGFGGYWYPGTAYAGQDHPAGTEGGDGGGDGGGESVREDAGMTWDGVNPTTDMFTSEDATMTWDGVNPSTAMFTTETEDSTDEEILKDFIDFCVKELKIDQMPRVKLRKDPQWSQVHKTFGRYSDDTKTLEVAWGQRHIMDVLRTVAHELTHKHQHEREGERMGPDAGETGSPYENEANARAGVLMRDYGRLHPEYFTAGQVKDLEESASGYIPTKAQAKDPRFSMALTVDIKPGQVGKEANKLKLRTDKQGHPQIARANGLFENLYKEYTRYKADEDYSPDAPPGPESKPTMPKGTVRVDVSDMYDWYKLGKNISNLKAVDKSQFGKGPPSTIVSFGDEDTEHKYIKDLENLGLTTTDIDPVDLKQPKSMKRQKTDPTYNVNESELLDEVKMSPSALQKWAKSPEAQGIRAGFEAELIFRDTSNNGDDDYEMEPDYDADERCRSIQQVIDFFQGGDYGGLSSRQERALQDGLDEQYYEWHDEQMYRAFRDEQEDLIKKVLVDENDWDLDNEIQKQLELLDLTDDEMNAIIQAGERAPKFTTSKEQILYAEQNPLYDKYLDAQNEAEGLLDELVQDSIRAQDKFYDAALDDFRDGFYIDDDSGFFDDVGLRWMSDVANSYDLDWPYMTGGGGNDGSRSWEEIGDSLHGVVNMPVKVSGNYHQTTRREGQWIVEPDSSLEPDDREDYGLEIVSPPMPLLDALEKLQEVTDWANSDAGNAYTNSSTGLHMGVSVPHKGGDVDYLKLILFLGDEYVLQQFGREANTYCKSAMSKFRENIKGGRTDPMGVIKLMQHGLLELAQREVQKGVGEGKYTSAHIQKGYIEFRSAGGDWLAEESADPEKLQNTMLRYARAMQIAANASEERREYAKKLYKLVAPEGDSELALFSQYASGELTAEQLKKRWAEKTIGTEKKMNQRWRLYQKIDGRWEPVPGAEWNGYSEDQVKNAVWSKYGREALDSGEYQLVNMGEQDWEVYDVNTGKTLEIVKGKSKGEVADAVYDKYVEKGIGFNVRPYEDPAKMTPRAKLAKRIVTPKPPKAAQETNERGVPYWEVYERETGHVVHTFLADTIHDAIEDAKNWLTSVNAEQPNLFSVRPKMNAGTPIKQPQSADDRQDSAHLRANLTRAPEPPDATQRSGSWSIYDVTLGREISRMDDVPWSQADARANELERSTGHNISVRGLSENLINESIDPVSGAGAVPPRQDPRSISKKSVAPVEKVLKQPAKGVTYRSAIGQAVTQKDLENMTSQIQMARRLGDSVMEMEDTPPEVMKALDQAAQKNGYKNWNDVKANPRSEHAVMAVAKLANAIMRTSGPHHEKMFYKNKTDVDENFADGKKPGRKGLAKRVGVNCKQPVSKLRKIAKNSSGERARMAHWCANMKSGRAKNK